MTNATATQYVDVRRVGSSWAVTEIGTDGLACTIWITGPNDTTAGESVARDYNPKCASCYLGHAHSGDLHRQQIA